MLPSAYAWLDKEPAPKMLLEAIKLYGVIEVPGNADSPTLLEWARELNLSRIYTHDAIPWCGLFVAICAHRAGWTLPVNPLWALNWSKWGAKADPPMLGDVLTFNRHGGGHVAIYVGEDAGYYHILGGNQNDKVCIERKSKSDMYSASHAHWKIAQPANVRRVHLDWTGVPLVTKES